MKNTFKFTLAKIAKLPSPTKKSREYYSDSGCKGLRLQITHKGTKTFQVRGWSEEHKKTIQKTIGKYPKVTLDVAQRECKKFNGSLAAGHDVQSERQQKRAEITCKEMFDSWLKEYGSNLKAGQESYNTTQRYCKTFFNKKICSVTSAFVQAWYNKLLLQPKRRGSGTISPGTANRCLINLRACFNLYLPHGTHNPCEYIKKGNTGQGEKFLDGNDLKKFLKSVEDDRKGYGDDAADFFLCCLFTGARSGNIKTMRWKDIYDWTWQISAAESKSRKIIGIALSTDVQKILKRRRENQKKNNIISPFIFPNPKTKSGHIEQPKTAWKRIMDRAGLPHSQGLEGYRIHDLRHSLGSHLALAGCSLPEIQQALGHKDSRTTERYMHLSPDRSVMEKAAKRMKEQSEKVQNIKRAK